MKSLVFLLITIFMVFSTASFAQRKNSKRECKQPWAPKVHRDKTSSIANCPQAYKGSRPHFLKKKPQIAPASGDMILHGKYPKNSIARNKRRKGDQPSYARHSSNARRAPGNDRVYNPKDWN